MKVIFTKCDGTKFAVGQSQPIARVRNNNGRGYLHIGAWPVEVSDIQYEKLKAALGDDIKKVTAKTKVAAPIHIEYDEGKKPLIEVPHEPTKPIEKTEKAKYSKEELKSMIESMGFGQFRAWSKKTFGVTDRSASVLVEEILKKQG